MTGSPATRISLASPSFSLAALAVSIAISFQILLPVVPVIVERNGPHGVAGAATGALFIGAVAGELVTPWLIARLSSTRVLVAGQILTAVPSLVYLLPHAAAWVMLAAASARGVGMGVAIVVSVALVSELSPQHRRGVSIGYFGLALSAPGIFVPSVGVFLLAKDRPDAAALIAFVSGLAGAVLASRLPDRSAETAKASTNLLSAIRRPGLFAVLAGFVLTSCSFGGVVTYVPVALPLDGYGSAAAFLLVSGAARAASRWLAGVLGDRRPARLVLFGSAALSLAGLVVLAAHGGPAAILIAAVAYGMGYGAVQTSTYLAMTERGTSADAGSISALWNSGIDLGSSLGGTLIGLTAARYGYAGAVWVLPAAVGLALPLFLWPAKSVPPHVADA